jgi:hypothetical protein
MSEQTQTSNADPSVYDSSETLFSQAPPTEASVEDIADAQSMEPTPSNVDAENPITEEQAAQTEEESVAEPTSAKDDPNRIAYWQSQADLHKNDSQRMANELATYQGIVERMVNEQKQAGIPEPPQAQAPAQVPAKPTSYNEVDAYNDPDSDSFKYRVAREEYRESRLDQVLNAVQQQEAARQQEAVRQQEAMVANQAYTHVKNGYGWDENKSADFVQWAQNPSNVTVDVLAKVFEMQNAPKSATQQAQVKAEELRQAGERLSVPRTTAVTSGQAEPQVTEQDSFNAGLLAHSRVRK